MSRRGVPSASVIALDAPRRIGLQVGLVGLAGALLVGTALVVGFLLGDRDLGDARGVSTAATVMMAVAGGAAAYLIYSHAAFSRNRAFLALGSTYLAAAWCALILLAVTEGAFIAGERLLGGPQSAPWTAALLSALLPIGIAVTALIGWNDARRYRRPGRHSHVTVSVVASVAVVGIAGAVLVGAPSDLPELLDPIGDPTTAWMTVWAAILAISVLALAAVVGLSVSRYTTLAAWTAAVGVLMAATSLMNLTRPPVFSVSWLVSLVLSLAAVALVPALMLTQLGRVERDSTRVASEDPLTGLMSRNGLLGRLDHEIGRAAALDSPGALLWIDLDGFTAVNDQFGHGGGDAALQQVAARLRHAARPTDTVSRVGGDEFAILVVDLHDPEDATTIATRALAGLREPVTLDGMGTLLTASIGIAHFATDALDADDLLHHADLAMHCAKQERGDQFSVYDVSMARLASDRAASRQRLARGLREDAFELHYQPVVDLRSGVAIGAEALVRWRREDGLVRAAEFIPMAESTGQIRSVGRLVLELLAQDLRCAGELGPDFRVAVNLSVPELADPGTVDRLCTGDLSSFLDHLTIEVTEGVMLAEHEQAVHNLARIREAGAVIALDDFGSGFANLEALAGLDPDLVKVDGVFTRRAGMGEASGLAFLRAAHAIGTAIGARVLAEGIETAGELRTVTEVGIDLGQGYMLGEPEVGLRR